MKGKNNLFTDELKIEGLQGWLNIFSDSARSARLSFYSLPLYHILN